MTNWVAVSSLAITGLAVICSCFNVGLVMGREKLRVDRSNIGWLVRAIVLNIVLVPLLALGLIWAFDLEAGLAASLVVLSALPAFPLIISIMRGRAIDTNGLELTFMMLGISAISAPLIIWLSPVEGLDAGLTEMMLTLVLFQLLPLVIGYWLGRIKPELYEHFEDILTFLVFISTSLIVLYVFVSRYKDIGQMGGTHALLAVIALVLMGVFLGWVVGGPRKEERRTLALNTSLRNFMSCLLLVFTFFSGAGTELLVLLGGLFMLALGIIVEKISFK
jgi:BASS family bile acid:Na+ symporter